MSTRDGRGRELEIRSQKSEVGSQKAEESLFTRHAADLKPILESRPELAELLSHVVARQQQHLLAILDEAAIRRGVIEQTDLLSRIRNFFHLNA
jgi:CBS-domain-containing membrane protein